MGNTGLIMLLGTLILAISGIYIILVLDAKKRGQGKSKNLASYNKKFKFLRDNFLTRKSFRQIVSQISGLGIYNFMEIRVQSVKFYLNTLYVSVGLMIVGIFVFRDIISSCILAIYALVMRTVLISKRIDGVKFTLLRQLSATIANLRESYTKLGNIPDAINECQKGTYLSKSFEQIYIIVTSNDGAKKLDEFYQTSPFRLLQTLASTCFILNDAGDTKNNEGVSTFKQALMLIKNEVDMEIRKLTQQRIKFNMLEYLPLAPLFVVGVLQSFFMSNIPGTSVMYNGLLGYVSRLLIVLSSFIGYYLITTINSQTAVSSNDRLETIDNLLRLKGFKRFVKDVMPKKARIRNSITKKIRGCLSSKDISYIYASKTIISGIVFIFSFLALLLMVNLSKDFTYNNVRSLSLLGGTELTEMQFEAMRKLDHEMLAYDFCPPDKEITPKVALILPKATEMEKLEQAERIKKKYRTYHNTGFKWWFVLISYGISCVSWFAPEMLLKLRAYLVKAEAEEDVLQMQTIIAILMDTSLDTLDVLYWLEKNSVVHKDALLFAYHEYPSNPEKALNRLKSKSTIPEFHQLCDKLLSTIHQISLAEAFADLISERNHIMQLREMVQEASIEKKRRIASPLSLAPIFIMVLGHVLAPIGILGYQEFVNALSQAGF